MAVRELTSDHPREKKMKTENKNDKKVYLVAQEFKLARVLAGNNKTSRDRALKSLKKWFTHRSKTLPFTDNDFQVIWKGLYFSMWMSDKPLIQEECAENIAGLVHFQTLDESILFFKAGLTTLINEWFGIDQLRLDKFLMLVRRLLRHTLIVLKKAGLSKKNIDKFNEVISFTVLNTDIHPPVGLFMHFTEIFLEELAKITGGNIPSERLVDFIRPFIRKLVVANDGREIAHIKKFIFTHLIKQSNLGIDYQNKYEAWKKIGFPGNIDSMQKVKLDDDEKMSGKEETSENTFKEKPLDPRAGRVDVELPLIKFKAKDIVNVLVECKFDKNSNSKSRKTIGELINHFTKMSKGVYPLGTKRVLDTGKDSYDTNVRKAANRLIKFENKLLGKDKKKKRSRENDEDTTEVLRKRQKISVDEEVAVNGDTVMEEELEKFIVQSEGNSGKKNKIKTGAEKPRQSIDTNVLNTQEKSSIDKDEGTIVKKIKKVANRTEVEAKSVDETEKKLKRKRKVDTKGDKKETKKKRSKKAAQEEIIDYIECVFERNSGTWVVFDVSGDREETGVIPTQKIETCEVSLESSIKVKESPSTSSLNSGDSESALQSDKSPSTFSGDLGSPNDENQTPTKNKASSSKNSPAKMDSPKSGVNPVRLFESPEQKKDLFPNSPWDEPLQDGEYEICIPAKKHVAKLQRKAKKNKQSVHELINTSMKQIRGKGRLSLDTGLVKNPFSTPNSKKVKINTKLNKSQEIHEHVQQILSSPGIPYDANKKPLKPLLKASASSTPVNPFYNKQLNVW